MENFVRQKAPLRLAAAPSLEAEVDFCHRVKLWGYATSVPLKYLSKPSRLKYLDHPVANIINGGTELTKCSLQRC